jgi:glycosyltransferase involved in cell wall biosynthesis
MKTLTSADGRLLPRHRPPARAANDADARAEPRPDVSVVVPTCGRADLLARCLRALAAQRIEPPRFEIVVVDDRPAAATERVVRQWAERARPLGVRYIASRGPHGPAAARNIGWRAARGDVIAFTDDDTEPDARWLRNGLRAMRLGVDAVCGRVVMPIPERPTDYERDASGLERSEFVTANCFCRRRALEALGGFDERFRLAWREDSDLHFRLLESGARIARAEDAVVVHPVRPAPWGASVRQQKKVAFDALLYKKHPRLYRARIRAAPRWDYYAVVGALLAVALGAALSSAALAAVAAAVWTGLTARLCAARLRGASKAPAHVAEMILTSIAIPPLAVFWRAVGALRYRVIFA